MDGLSSLNARLLLKHVYDESVLTSIGLSVAVGAVAFITLFKPPWKWHVRPTRNQNLPRNDTVRSEQPKSSSETEIEGPVYRTWAELRPKADRLLEEFNKIRPELPYYSASDIENHNHYDPQSINNSSVWFSFRKSVFDVTDFVKRHPGGHIILEGAGKSVDNLFEIYAQHKNLHILVQMKQFRIGNLAGDPVDVTKLDDPYAREPQRNPKMQLFNPKPYNSCPPTNLLIENFVTPADIVYTRNHLPVPQVNVEEFQLHITGPNVDAKLTLDELKSRFSITQYMAVLSCSGNRRREMELIKKTAGSKFDQGAIANCLWKGVYLRDVLLHVGLDENCGKHMHFDSLDVAIDGTPYTISLPMEMCFDPKREIILTFEQNDQPLLPDHGFPLRLFVPGSIGAWCVKWLSRIHVEDQDCRSHAQRVDNKLYPPYANWETADFDNTPVVRDHIVNSAICIPENGQTVRLVDGKVYVKGYAWTGGGKKIIRVEITCNDGKSFIPATLIPPQMSQNDKAWGWYWWEAYLPMPKKDTTCLKIACRAVDSSYAIQPEHVRPLWNIFGEYNNAYHRITINIEH